MIEEMEEWITTTQAAETLGVDRDWITKLCRQQRLTAKKLGRDWLVSSQSARAYRDTPRNVGRPKKLLHKSS